MTRHTTGRSPGGRRLHFVALGAITALTVSVAACGDDDVLPGSGDASPISDTESGESGDDATAEATEEATEEFGEALGVGGGGGILVFDGEEIPIDSVTCVSGGDDFSVGTVSDNGYRVFVDSSSTGVPNAQVLDADSAQWTPVDRGESIEIGDGSYSSPPTVYSDIRDSSREVQVSFTIECP
jgi:hypothetical protein